MNELTAILENQEVKANIQEAFKEDRLLFIRKQFKTIGFLTWYPVDRDGRHYVYIGNMYILEQYRNEFNIFSLRKILRDRFPGGYFLWHRKDGYHYWR